MILGHFFPTGSFLFAPFDHHKISETVHRLTPKCCRRALLEKDRTATDAELRSGGGRDEVFDLKAGGRCLLVEQCIVVLTVAFVFVCCVFLYFCVL